jgi:hypothetical protein
VNADGQLYTIEGVAAGLIMLLTAYIVVNSTSVYTPGDTHISDMQLEVTGSDALLMMNTAANASPDGTLGKSPLALMIENNDQIGFGQVFNSTLNNRTGGSPDRIQFLANVSYVRWADNTTDTTTLLNMSRPLTGGEHAVRVTQWVIVEKRFPLDCTVPACKGKHAVLVEALLWRD